MLEGLSLGHIINYFREKWQTLPDMRNQDNNNLTYPIVDVALSAFSVFFMQSPSFLAHQRDIAAGVARFLYIMRAMAVRADCGILIAGCQRGAMYAVLGFLGILLVAVCTNLIHLQLELTQRLGGHFRVWITGNICVAGNTLKFLLPMD